MAFKFHTDEETKLLLDVTAHFLEEYFGYEESQAIDLINRYYIAHKDEDDDYYHHLGPFHIAVLIHYIAGLQRDGRDFHQWKKDNGLIDAPKEAVDYTREHFYNLFKKNE